ncbi:MAG: DNA polymerase Y family protein, partial [Pseudomonadota bacterium]
ASWARRWSPWVSTEGEDGLLLDVTGCAHLFGGEEALLEQIRARFAKLHITVRLALAPTRAAAWALARYGPAQSIVTPSSLQKAVSPLPVAALNIDDAAQLLLRRVGLKTIGQLMAVPTAALAKRFNGGALTRQKKAAPIHPLVRLDEMFGKRAAPLSPLPHRPRLRVVQSLMEPIGDVSAVEAVLFPLIDRLATLLDTEGKGTRALKLEAFRTDGTRAIVFAATSRPTRQPAHMRRLFKDKLETVDAGFGFDAIALEAVRAQPLEAVPADLSGAAGLEGDEAALIDRLSARLGQRAVLRPVPVESHLPERAIRWEPALHYSPPKKPVQLPLSLPQRPHRLFEPPEEIDVTYGVPEDPPRAFTWRRKTHRVAKVEGPERLAPEWWRQGPMTRLRDYYRVEDDAGRRYWLFRYGRFGDGRGAFEDAPPQWFLHGLFA